MRVPRVFISRLQRRNRIFHCFNLYSHEMFIKSSYKQQWISMQCMTCTHVANCILLCCLRWWLKFSNSFHLRGRLWLNCYSLSGLEHQINDWVLKKHTHLIRCILYQHSYQSIGNLFRWKFIFSISTELPSNIQFITVHKHPSSIW